MPIERHAESRVAKQLGDSFFVLILFPSHSCLLALLTESITLYVLTHVPENLTISFDELVPRFYFELTPNRTKFEECKVVSTDTVDSTTANITCKLPGNLPTGTFPLAVFAEGFGLGMLAPVVVSPNISSVSPNEVGASYRY